MAKDNSGKNLQNSSFKDEDLSYANFSGSDLRGADFTNANLTGADLSGTRTGIDTTTVVLLFVGALAVSLLSGYVAMLTGRTVHEMFISKNPHVRNAGILSTILIVGFIVYAWRKGGRSAIRNMIIPVVICALLIGIVVNLFGLGTGNAMWYMILSLVLIVVMFVIGTIARSAAGSLSNILFLVVALSGGMFGRSVGGGIGTVVMAIVCMQVSKKALSGAPGFEFLRSVATKITSKFGTSFRHAKLVNTNFSNSRLHNVDFTAADLSSVNWNGAKKVNCIEGNTIITDTKKHKHG